MGVKSLVAPFALAALDLAVLAFPVLQDFIQEHFVKVELVSDVVFNFQYAGKSLRELQKALKNPLANMGVLTGAATQRARR